MALESAVQNDRHTGQTITWNVRSSVIPAAVAPKVLTGSTLSGTLTDPDGTTRAIDGTLTVTDGPNGVFTWAYGVLDTANANKYLVQFTAVYPDLKQDSSFEAEWEVKAKR